MINNNIINDFLNYNINYDFISSVNIVVTTNNNYTNDFINNNIIYDFINDNNNINNNNNINDIINVINNNLVQNNNIINDFLNYNINYDFINDNNNINNMININININNNDVINDINNINNMININNNIINVNNLILDYDFVENIAQYQLLDNIAPILNYDMERYINEKAIQSHKFYKLPPEYSSIPYKWYLESIATNTGNRLFKIKNAYESHILVLYSTLKKILVLNYNQFELDSLDYYILDWVKTNVSINEFKQCVKVVKENPNPIILMKYHYDTVIFNFKG